jgi:MFS family permease
MRVADRFGPFQERPFRLLWLGRTTSLLGDAAIGVALPFAVLQTGGSATELGLVLAVTTVARAVFVVVGGVWSDRLPRRMVMLTCDVIRAAVQAMVAVALLSDAMRWWMFLPAATVYGAAAAFFGPASTGILPETVSGEWLQQANALLSISQSGATIVGPALSGALVAFADAGWAYALDAATFAGSAACLAFLRLPPLARAAGRRFMADIAEGWQEIRRRTWLWGTFVNFSLINFAVGAEIVLGPLIARDYLGGAGAWGLISASGAVGGVAGAILVYRLRPARPLIACYGGWLLMAAPSIALAAIVPLPVIMAASAAFGLGLAVGNTLWETVLQLEIPGDRLSRVSSIDWMVSLVFMPLGSALAGPLSAAVGLRPSMLAVGALIVAVDAAVFVTFRSVRTLQAQRVASSAATL